MREVFNSERVSISDGKLPIVLVSALCEDENIGFIVREIAKEINCYYITNNGWEKSKNIDQKKDKANCSDTFHCHEDVVKEEFLDPIIKFKNKILKAHPMAYFFYIGGIDNSVRDLVDDESLGYIVGYGAGKVPYYTCHKWVKNCFVYLLANTDNCRVYEGREGGKFNAYSQSNLTQLFTRWYKDNDTQSMQVLITHDLRDNKEKAETTAEILGIVMQDLVKQKDFVLTDLFKIRKI